MEETREGTWGPLWKNRGKGPGDHPGKTKGRKLGTILEETREGSWEPSWCKRQKEPDGLHLLAACPGKASPPAASIPALSSGGRRADKSVSLPRQEPRVPLSRGKACAGFGERSAVTTSGPSSPISADPLSDRSPLISAARACAALPSGRRSRRVLVARGTKKPLRPGLREVLMESGGQQIRAGAASRDKSGSPGSPARLLPPPEG